MSEKPKTGPIVPFKTLEPVEGYFSVLVGEQQWVLKVQMSIGMIKLVENMKGEDGRPSFHFTTANSGVVLTPEEYKIVRVEP